MNFSGLPDKVFYKLIFIVKRIAAEELNIPESKIYPLFELTLSDRKIIIDRIRKVLNISYSGEIETLTNVAKIANRLGKNADANELPARLDTILEAGDIEFDFSETKIAYASASNSTSSTATKKSDTNEQETEDSASNNNRNGYNEYEGCFAIVAILFIVIDRFIFQFPRPAAYWISVTILLAWIGYREEWSKKK